jgi:hypothetical protein
VSKTFRRLVLGGLVLAAPLWTGVPDAAAVIVPNTVTGDIAGNPADLDQTNATINLDVTTLGLVKTAFLTDGTQLASGAAVPRGTRVRFLIYVDNPTNGDVPDLNVADVLPAAFGYVAGTLKVDDTIVSGSAPAAIYAAVDAQAPLTDAVDGDAAGYTGGSLTVSAGSSAGNAPVVVPRGNVWALLFEVVVQ